MVLADGWPAASGVVDALELREHLAGLLAEYGDGSVAAGLFPNKSLESPNKLLNGTSGMNVSVSAFNAVANRSGAVLISNIGAALVPIAAAPAANSRIDVIYVRQNENANGFSDGNNSPIFGVLQGTAASSPVRNPAALPAGAVELGTILVPANVTSTNATGVVLTDTYKYAGLSGGPVALRGPRATEAPLGFPEGQLLYRKDMGWFEGSDGLPLFGKMPELLIGPDAENVSSNVSAPAGSWTTVRNYPAAAVNQGGFVVNSAGVVAVPFAGDYEVTAVVFEEATAQDSGRFMAILYGSGSRLEYISRRKSANSATVKDMITGVVRVLDSAKNIWVQMYQDSSGAINIRPSYLHIRYLGPSA